MKRITLLLVVALVSVGVSQAGVEVNFTGTSPGGGGTTLFTYDIDVGDETTWRTNDFVVPFDFGPVMQAFSVLPAMLSFGATSATGPNAPAQAPTDSASILNVQLINMGPDIIGPAFSGGADFTFSLASPTSTVVNGTLNISTQYFDNAGGTGVAGGTSNVPVPGSGLTAGPLSDVPGNTSSPEPATMGLIGCALAGVALLVNHRRK